MGVGRHPYKRVSLALFCPSSFYDTIRKPWPDAGTLRLDFSLQNGKLGHSCYYKSPHIGIVIAAKNRLRWGGGRKDGKGKKLLQCCSRKMTAALTRMIAQNLGKRT
jgi:hypothetical protein